MFCDLSICYLIHPQVLIHIFNKYLKMHLQLLILINHNASIDPFSYEKFFAQPTVQATYFDYSFFVVHQTNHTCLRCYLHVLRLTQFTPLKQPLLFPSRSDSLEQFQARNLRRGYTLPTWTFIKTQKEIVGLNFVALSAPFITRLRGEEFTEVDRSSKGCSAGICAAHVDSRLSL